MFIYSIPQIALQKASQSAQSGGKGTSMPNRRLKNIQIQNFRPKDIVSKKTIFTGEKKIYIRDHPVIGSIPSDRKTPKSSGIAEGR